MANPRPGTPASAATAPKRIPGWLLTILLIVVIVLGVTILAYPAVSNWVAQQRHQSLIGTYQANISELPEETYMEEWRKALDYNESLIGNPVKDPFITGSGTALKGNYMDVLNIDGIMGYIDIPCIDVHLPVYHGTSEAVLTKGVGHLESTALPTGGEGLNPIFSAHTGIPSSKLFTDLTKIRNGDMFFLSVLDKTLTYKVDSIQVILPEETTKLTAVAGKDHVTLLTCTPYGINSHRLVVRGERCYELAESLILNRQNTVVWLIALVVCGLLFFLFLFMLIWRSVRKYPNPLTMKGVR